MVGASLGVLLMAPVDSKLMLRPAPVSEVELIADLAALYDPDDPRDAEMLRFTWESSPKDEPVVRMLASAGETTIGYFAAGHGPWQPEAERFGWIRVVIVPGSWTEARYLELVGAAQGWQRAEGTSTVVARLRSRFSAEIESLEASGYHEVRRQSEWELDLAGRRDQLLATAAAAREKMKAAGVSMLTLDQDHDPDKMQKVYDLTNESEQDIPTTVPIRTLPYDDWYRLWFASPAIRFDRVWIARLGDDIVGISMIEIPPQRGVAWTAYTGTAKRARGRGIARALKYETVVQAIALGLTRIRTSNDGDNAPILHINAEMGYQRLDPMIELHRALEP